jgi:hypothetical protein
MDAVLITPPQKQTNQEAIVHLILHQHQHQRQYHVQRLNMDAVLITLPQKRINQEAIVHVIHQPPADVPEPFMDVAPITQLQKLTNQEAIVHLILPYKLIRNLFLLLHLYNLIPMLFLYPTLFLPIHQPAQNLNHALLAEDVLNHPLIVKKYPIMQVQIPNIYPFLF